MHSFSFSPPPVREAASSERLQKNARMFLFSEKSVSSQLSITVFVETVLPLCSLMSVVNHASFSVEVGASGAKGATLGDWGEHMRVLCGTVIDFTAFLCLSLPVFVVQGFPGSIPVFHSKRCGEEAGQSTRRFINQYVLLHKHSSLHDFPSPSRVFSRLQ